MKAGNLLKHWRIDVIFTSELVRAIQTAMLVMSKNCSGIPKIEHENGMMKEWDIFMNGVMTRACI